MTIFEYGGLEKTRLFKFLVLVVEILKRFLLNYIIINLLFLADFLRKYPEISLVGFFMILSYILKGGDFLLVWILERKFIVLQVRIHWILGTYW